MVTFISIVALGLLARAIYHLYKDNEAITALLELDNQPIDKVQTLKIVKRETIAEMPKKD